MIDPHIIRNDPDKVKQIIRNGRGNPQKADIDRWLKLDNQRKELMSQLEELNRERNKLAERGKSGNVEGLKEEGRALKEKTAKIEDQLKEINPEWQEIQDWIPNIPVSEKDMPIGKGEEDNLAIKAWIPEKGYIDEKKLGKVGETAQYMPKEVVHADDKNFKPQHHLDLGEKLGMIDNKQAALVAGTRFTYLTEDIALLQYSLQQFLFNKLLKENFHLVVPPLMVKERVLYGTSHFPEGRDQVYKIDSEYLEEQNQLFLVGSSEPSNFAFFMDKVIDEKELPYKMVAYTACFRSEVGSWGKDVRGIKRVHQFDKIEMDVVCTPEQSIQVFDELLAVNEWILQQLELPYHLVLKCTGDAGYLASAKQIDPEVWLSGQQTFMEVGTDTNATDFQARRMNIKFKDKDGKTRLVNTVNDTGIPMGRMIIAIMDNYQQADGSIKVPKVLQQYMGKEYIKKA